MSRAVLDTSVFIAQENDRPLSDLPDEISELAVSVVTLAELELGVLVAADMEPRSRRLATLTRAREIGAPVPIDGRVASSFAAVVAEAKQRRRTLRVQDAWIAATALAHDAALVTQDRDFERVAGLDAVLV